MVSDKDWNILVYHMIDLENYNYRKDEHSDLHSHMQSYGELKSLLKKEVEDSEETQDTFGL